MKGKASTEGWALTQQVADVGRGLDSVPSQSRCDSSTAPRRQAAWLSPLDTACRPGPRSARAPAQAASLSLTGVTAWPPSLRLQVPAREHSTERFGFQASMTQGGLHRTSRAPSSLRSSPARCPDLLHAPSPPSRPQMHSTRTPAAVHPPPPNFLLQGDSWRWGVRVWCCLVICSRSGNNLKLNPQLFGSLL